MADIEKTFLGDISFYKYINKDCFLIYKSSFTLIYLKQNTTKLKIHYKFYR